MTQSYQKLKSGKGKLFRAVLRFFAQKNPKFNGRETLWEKTIKENQDIEIDFDFSFSKGQAKIVYIDSEDNVTTVIECLPETSTDGFVTKTLLLKSGKNRLKIVGYDCKDIDLEMVFTDIQ